VKRAGDKLGN